MSGLDVDSLPDEAKRHYARVYKSAVNAGCTDDDAHSIAWHGISNAGWERTEKGWSRVEKRRSIVVKRRALSRHDEFRLSVPIIAVEKAQTDDTVKVFGWASVALDDHGNVVVDHGQDEIPVPELEQAAYEFVKRASDPATQGSAYADAMHEGPDVARLIEACVITPQKRVSMGLDGTGKAGFWIGYEVFDPNTVRKVRSGELAEFSIYGDARRMPVEKRERGRLIDLVITKVALVDRGEGKGVTIQLVKQHESSIMNLFKKKSPVKKQEDGSDPAAMLNEILEELGPEKRAVVEMAMQMAAQSGAQPPPPPPEEAEKAEGEEAMPEEEKVEGEAEETEKADDEEKKEEEAKMNSAMAKRLHAAEVELEKMRKERRREHFEKLAKKYDAVAGFTTSDLATLLDSLEQTVPKADYEKVLKGLEQNAEVMKQLVDPFGSIGRGMDAHESDPIVAKAKAIAKDEGVKYSEAYAKAMKLPEFRAEISKSFRTQRIEHDED